MSMEHVVLRGSKYLLQVFCLSLVYVFKFRIRHFVIIEVHVMFQVPSSKLWLGNAFVKVY